MAGPTSGSPTEAGSAPRGEGTAREPRRRRAGWAHSAAVASVALAARLAVVAWASDRFPPAADGRYYHRLAERLAAGQGYT